MKSIRSDLTKFNRFSQFSQNHYISIWGYFLKISRNFTDLSKNYTLVFITGMFEALSLLVY